MLERFPMQHSGFPNLRYIKLIFDASPCLGDNRLNFRRWLVTKIVDGIEFPCKGEMEVVGRVRRRIVQNGRSQSFEYLSSEDANRLRTIDSILRSLVHFVCNKHKQNR